MDKLKNSDCILNTNNHMQCQKASKQNKDRFGRTESYQTWCSKSDTGCYDKVSWEVLKDISKQGCKPDVTTIKQIDGNEVKCITTCSSEYRLNDCLTIAITLIVVCYTFVWSYKLSKGGKRPQYSDE